MDTPASPGSDNPVRARGRQGLSLMWLFVLESFAALALLVFMVWWTMFSGRRGGERRDEDAGGDKTADRTDKD
ncbi:MAG TPA: hypothetical protein VLA16_17765 [Ideonella sp.]|nr:hypothetical protein [Ideonella sp.]